MKIICTEEERDSILYNCSHGECYLCALGEFCDSNRIAADMIEIEEDEELD